MNLILKNRQTDWAFNYVRHAYGNKLIHSVTARMSIVIIYIKFLQRSIHLFICIAKKGRTDFLIHKLQVSQNAECRHINLILYPQISPSILFEYLLCKIIIIYYR